MASRYWVGGSGTWSNVSTANWSAAAAITFTASCSGTALTTTGSPALVVGMTVYSNNNTSLGTVSSGSGNSWVVSVGGTYASQDMTAATTGASVPTSADNVFFNSTSSLVSYTATVSVSQSALNLTLSAPASGTFTFSQSGTFFFYGNLTIAASGVVASTFIGQLAASGTQTITTNNVLIKGISTPSTYNGTITLGSDINVSSILTRVTSGSYIFNTNNYNVTIGYWVCDLSASGTFNMGTSTFVSTSSTGLNFSGTNTYNFSSNNITLTEANSQIQIAAVVTLGSVTCTASSGACLIRLNYGSTINTLATTSFGGFKFAASNLINIGNFYATGISGSLIRVESQSAGFQYYLSKPSGVVSCNYLAIVDCVAQGGASWYAGSGSTSSNTTGWTLTNAPSTPKMLIMM